MRCMPSWCWDLVELQRTECSRGRAGAHHVSVRFFSPAYSILDICSENICPEYICPVLRDEVQHPLHL